MGIVGSKTWVDLDRFGISTKFQQKTMGEVLTLTCFLLREAALSHSLFTLESFFPSRQACF